MSNQRASFSFPISYTCSTLHENKMLPSWEDGGEKKDFRREYTGGTKKWEKEGDSIAHETIWVFPASSSGFGTDRPCFSPLPLSLTCRVCSVCTHALFIVAFINNLIENARGRVTSEFYWTKWDQYSPVSMDCKCFLQKKGEKERKRSSMSANLKDSNLRMLAVSSEMFAHSQHELLVCGLPLHCPYITYYRMNITQCRPFIGGSVKYLNTLLSISKHVRSSSGERGATSFFLVSNFLAAPLILFSQARRWNTVKSRDMQ